MPGFWKRLFGRGKQELLYERGFVVTVSDTEVVCQDPAGRRTGVRWEDLRSVEIVNTSDGPFLPDVFWVLSGAEGDCVIPWGATGLREHLIPRLQALPGFDDEGIISAACRTDDARTPCWRRPAD